MELVKVIWDSSNNNKELDKIIKKYDKNKLIYWENNNMENIDDEALAKILKYDINVDDSNINNL